MNYIIIFAVPYITTIAVKHLFLKAYRPKSRVYLVPTGMGFIFVISSVITFITGFFLGILPIDLILAYVVGMFSMGFIGLLNDMFNESAYSGVDNVKRKGLLKGNPVMRSVKAVLAVFAGTLVCLPFMNGFVEFLINLCIILGFTNLMNVLDEGPGRAVKFYIPLYFIIIFAGNFRVEAGISLVMLGAVVGYASSDLKSRLYMGDTGANILGVWLGITSIFVLPLNFKIVLALLLVILNLILETLDTEKIIRNNTFLRALDDWGRK